MNTMKRLIYLTIIFLASCKVQQTSSNSNPLLGCWKLHIMEIKDTDTNQWKEWRQGMTGYIMYEATGYMSLHLVPRDYPNTDLEFKNFTMDMPEEQLKYITQNYNYTGSYTIDQTKQIVSHTKLSHSNPNEWNELSERRFHFVNDTLFVRPVEEKNSGLRLKFLKMP